MQGRKIQRPHVISEVLANISGLQALYPENDLRTLLVLDLEKNLRDFKDIDVDCLTYNEPIHWTTWSSNIATTLERARQAITFGAEL